MTEAPSPTENRLDRRKARTRAALIRAAQTLIAQGRTNAPILEITQAADVGMGSFYNHFDTKERLYEAAYEAVRKLRDHAAGGVGEPEDVGGFGGPERGAEVGRLRSAAHDHTGCAAVGSAQLQLVRGPAHGGETEGVGESLGAGQVRLLELQPGQVRDLDRRIGRPTWVLPAEPSLFAVQVVVSPVMGGHRLFLSVVLTKSSLMTISSVNSY